MTAPKAEPGESNLVLGWALSLIMVIVIVPIAFSFAYAAMGITSVGYYGPPIGQVMQFAYNAATVTALSLGPLAAVLLALSQIPQTRRYLEGLVKKRTAPRS